MRCLLAIFLALASISRAAVQWPEIEFPDKAKAFTAGYACASLYDVYIAYNDIDIHAYRKGAELAGVLPIPMGEEVPYLLWKLGLGAAGGLMVGLHTADRDNRQIHFEEVVYGALGGLTCIVIHF